MSAKLHIVPARPARGRRIDWKDPMLAYAVALVAQGFADSCVTRETGLTPGMIAYRLHGLNLQHVRREYRQGVSQYAKLTVRNPQRDGVGPFVSKAVARKTAVVPPQRTVAGEIAEQRRRRTAARR